MTMRSKSITKGLLFTLAFISLVGATALYYMPSASGEGAVFAPAAPQTTLFGGWPVNLDGSTYSAIAGTPPHPASRDFARWCAALVKARRAQIVAPSATYYFSQAGFDAQGTGASQGDGSLTHPWQSLSKANTALGTTGVQCLFRRGDEWPTAVGVTMPISKSVSVGSYSDGTAGHDMAAPVPMIHSFTHSIGKGWAGWTRASSTNRYTLAGITPATITVAGVAGNDMADPSGLYVYGGVVAAYPYYARVGANGLPDGSLFFITYIGGDPGATKWIIQKSSTASPPTQYGYAYYWYFSANASETGPNATATTFGHNPAAGTTVPSATCTYAAAPANPTVGWVRNHDRRFDGYAWMNSTAGIEATPYSWYYDGTTLHVNCTPTGGSTVSPTTILWEFSDTTVINQNGLTINGSGHASGLRFDGWGCGPAGSGAQNKYPVQYCGDNTTAAFVEDVQAFYCGRHGIGSAATAGNGYGGPLTVVNCISGLTSDTDAGGTSTYVSYSTNGAHEGLFWNDIVAFGNLPWYAGVLGGGYTGCDICGSHGGDAHGGIGMLLVWGMKTFAQTQYRNATWGDGKLFYGGDSVTPGDTTNITSLRVWQVDCDYSVPTAAGNGIIVPSKCVAINNNYSFGWNNTASSLFHSVGGWEINAQFNANNLLATYGLTVWTDSAAVAGNIVNSRVTVCDNATQGGLSVTKGTNDGQLVNNAFSVISGKGNSTVLTAAANRSHNAYAGFTTLSIGGEAGAIQLSAPCIGGMPDSGSPLYQAGTSTVTVLGVVLQYDANWNFRRPTPASIGAAGQ